MTGKITKGIGGFYYVHAKDDMVYECKAKGIFRNRKVKPLVGDDVEMEIITSSPPVGNIVEILDRKNELIRPAVSNIDQAFLVFACKDPEPNWNLLDRFLVMMNFQNVPVTICFNKADLIEEEQREYYCTLYGQSGCSVLFSSTKTGEGVNFLKKQMDGKTSVFAGPSGVGKSSLLNAIMGMEQMETGAISEKIKRGKHTTRHSEFFCIGEDTYLLDTPGFSSIWMPEMKEEELKDYFPEFAKFEEECRFIGCVHVGERQCGVKDAVAAGDIPEERYKNYMLMYQEIKSKRKY